MDALVSTTSEALNARGIRGGLVIHRDGLYWRGYFNTASGRSQKRIHLGLSAHPGQLLEAEKRVIELASAVAETGVLPEQLPWAKQPGNAAIAKSKASKTVAEAVSLLEAEFWSKSGREERTSAAQRTWQRLKAETDRLPKQATLTVELLVSFAKSTPAGSRSRLEACKVYTRLGRLVKLGGLEELDGDIRKGYKPQRRKPPSDEELLELLEQLPENHHWSWPTWALVTYGCRPAEVFSLKPDTDGTAQVLSVKEKLSRPVERTALALAVGKVVEPKDNRSWRFNTPDDYDSYEAKRATGAWGKWLGARTGGMQLYDLRHAWALRSIHRNINASLAAETMGHSLHVHNITYHRELTKRDVAAVAAGLRLHKT